MDAGRVLGLDTRVDGGMMRDRDAADTRVSSRGVKMAAINLNDIVIDWRCCHV